MGRRINVGCGEYPLGPPFENIDLFTVAPAKGYVGRKVIEADALMFDYAGAEIVTAGHFIEHLTVGQAQLWLRTVYAHVPRGCVLVVTTPAWDRVAHADFTTMQAMGGGEGRWKGDQHRSWWRTLDLAREMTLAGWKDVTEYDAPWLVARVKWQVCLRGVK